jgi:hypothetical protein
LINWEFLIVCFENFNDINHTILDWGFSAYPSVVPFPFKAVAN